VQDETARLQGRGDGSERPANEGDLSPDHGERRDLAPIVVPAAHDEGGDAATETTELEAALDATPAARFELETHRGIVGSEGEFAPFRGLEDLPAPAVDPWPD
jgi:hypothetical protein